jgi:hypothetical protein
MTTMRGKKAGKTGKRAKRRGPEPERVKLTGDWRQAIGRALKKSKPPKTGQ